MDFGRSFPPPTPQDTRMAYRENNIRYVFGIACKDTYAWAGYIYTYIGYKAKGWMDGWMGRGSRVLKVSPGWRNADARANGPSGTIKVIHIVARPLREIATYPGPRPVLYYGPALQGFFCFS